MSCNECYVLKERVGVNEAMVNSVTRRKETKTLQQ